MSDSLMMHYVKSVTTDGFDPTNSNAITLTITKKCGDALRLTLFGLDIDKAAYLSDVLQAGRAPMTEEAIRADERRKIAYKLGL
jgi:hypothetical protein